MAFFVQLRELKDLRANSRCHTTARCNDGTNGLTQLGRYLRKGLIDRGFAEDATTKTSMDISKSRTPLLSFTEFCLQNPEEFKLRTDTITDMINLKAMTETIVDVQQSASTLNEEIRADVLTVDLDVPRNIQYVPFKDTKTQDLPFPEVTEERRHPPGVAGNYRSFERTYWVMRARMPRISVKHFATEELLHLHLPENFLWLLHYFSAHAGVSIVDLYFDLLQVEFAILEHNSLAFGKVKEIFGTRKTLRSRKLVSTPI